MSRVVASVVMVTFNQGPYVARAVECILAQHTAFPFELVIGEDESTDGTREICVEYARRFPERIRLFLRSRRDVVYVDGRATGRHNFLQTVNACGGDYVAFCEGDDYWHDPHKLQVQVDYLAAHPDCSFVHSAVRYEDLVNGRIVEGGFDDIGRQRRDAEDVAVAHLLSQYDVRTCSMCVRGDLLRAILAEEAEDFDGRFMMADTQLVFHLARRGRVHFFPQAMATYRRIPRSATSMGDPRRRYEFLANGLMCVEYLCEKYALPRAARRQLVKRHKALLSAAFDAGLLKEGRTHAEAMREGGVRFGRRDWVHAFGVRGPRRHRIAKALLALRAKQKGGAGRR